MSGRYTRRKVAPISKRRIFSGKEYKSMTTEPFQLKQCWDSQRIGQVINKEATSVDSATFMAIHTPLTKLEYQTYLQQMTDTTEEGLFLELQRCADQDIHVFMAIQGIPGSGKSH